jgi:glycine/D-amino acid oxidase-like deaminating enzyme
MGTDQYDVIVVGGGTAGLATAIEAADHGLRILIVEKDTRLGGTLHTTGGHLVAAGTKRQAAHGIEDSQDAWLADIDRITRGLYRPDIIEPVVEHAAEFIDWLDDSGFRFAPETPRIIYGHEPYRTPRTYYGVDAGLSLLEVFKQHLDRHLAAGLITVWLDSPVLELRTNPQGDVVGVTTMHEGKDVEVDAPHTVVATGGFGNEPELFQELVGLPLVSASHPTATGDGLLLGQAIGAAFQGEGVYLPTFGGLPHPTSPGKAQWEDRPVLVVAERTPWEIYVDRHGQRWVAEDEYSIDAKERALCDVEDLTFWTVFDDVAVDESVPMIVNWTPDDVRARANVREGVHRADTLEELAQLAGIDVGGLLTTVNRYNDAVDSGHDSEFGREILPARIERAPFYAMRQHGITLVTFVGLDVDGQMRVRREDGSIIGGLYATGEVIGATATTGQSFCSGMMITPGVVHGRLLARRLAGALPFAPPAAD